MKNTATKTLQTSREVATDERVRELRREALIAGDRAMARTCALALTGSRLARMECADALLDAEAQRD